MYLSFLRFNPLSPAVHKALLDPYRTHAALMRGFPPDDGSRVLFRVEPPGPDGANQRVTVLVQSLIAPDWTNLKTELGNRFEAEFKEISPRIQTGQRLRFRLRANPVVTRNGNRYGLVGDEDQVKWLTQKGAAGGFDVRPGDIRVTDEGVWKARKKDGNHTLCIRTALFDGVLTVTNAETFLETLAKGVGPAKGFGCGLLSPSRA